MPRTLADFRLTPESTAAINKAFKSFAKVISDFWDGLRKAFAPLIEIVEKDIHLQKYGPRNLDENGVWITDMCAGWLHESCPSKYCECRCHE